MVADRCRGVGGAREGRRGPANGRSPRRTVDVGLADADVADVLGRIAVAVLIGAQHRGATTDRDALAAMYRLLTEVTDRVYAPTPKS